MKCIRELKVVCDMCREQRCDPIVVMDPLGEGTALELLKRVTHVLQHALEIERISLFHYPSPLPKLFVRPTVAGFSFPPGFHADGAATRLAIDAMNTLCAREGYGVDENPRFWRRVLVEWLLVPRDWLPVQWEEQQLPPLDPRLFSRYDFELMPYLREPDATQFWRELILTSSWGDHHRATRSELERVLAPYIVRTVRPLHIHVPMAFVPFTSSGQQRYEWEISKRRVFLESCRALQQQQQQQQQQSGRALRSTCAAVTVHIQVIASALLRPQSARVAEDVDVFEAADLPIAVDEVVFGDRWDELDSYDVPWSQYVGGVARISAIALTVPSLFVLDVCGEPCAYGAHASIIPHSNSLQRVTCSLTGFKYLLKWAWVLYALYHPSRRDAATALDSLTLDTNKPLSEKHIEYIEEILRNGLPLRDVVLATVYPKHKTSCCRQHEYVDCFAFGATVVVLAHQWLYYSPHGMDKASDRAVRLKQMLQLDLIAHVPVRGWVAVVYPGWGLLWTTTTAMRWTNPREWRTDVDVPLGQLLHCRALELRLEKYNDTWKPSKRRRTETATPTSPLPLFLGPTLQSLTLMRHSPLTETDLECIVAACPQLKRLVLRECIVQTLSPLVAPTASPLTALRVGWKAHESWVPTPSGQRLQQPPPVESDLYAPLLAVLSSNGHPLANSLRELDVALAEPTYADSTLTRLRDALLLPTTRLESITIRCRLAASVVVDQFALFHDQVLVDPVEVALLLLRVLYRIGMQTTVSDATRRQRGGQSIGTLVVRHVCQFTGGPVRRHVRVLDLPEDDGQGRHAV